MVVARCSVVFGSVVLFVMSTTLFGVWVRSTFVGVIYRRCANVLCNVVVWVWVLSSGGTLIMFRM